MFKLKNIFTLLFLLVCGSVYTQIPTNGNIACYPFSGNTNDYSGNGHNGTNSGAIFTSDYYNRANNAYFFNGSNAHITLQNINDLLVPNFTYSAWVKVSSYPANGNVTKILSIGGGPNTQNICLFNNYNSNLNGLGFYGANQGGTTSDCDFGLLPQLNTWYHIAITRSNNSVKLYINGNFERENLINNHVAVYGGGINSAIIGASTGLNQHFNGNIDDIHIYNRKLTAIEILSLYGVGTNTLTITSNSGDTICMNENVTFIANGAAHISNPNYQWYVNSNAVGINAQNYTTSTLINGDILWCYVFPPANDCEAPVLSNSISMTVNPLNQLGISIIATPGDTVCKGDLVLFNSIVTNGFGNLTYQWTINGINVGNQNSLTLDTLSNGAIVNCILTSSAECLTNNPASSLPIQMTINEIIPLIDTITAFPSNIICKGDKVTFNAYGYNGGSTYSYQWKLNGINVGVNQESIDIDTLSNGDIVTCIYSSTNSCVSNNPATSNPIVMIVKDFSALQFQIIASPSTSICKGTNVQLTAEIIGPPANGVTCQWQINGTYVGTTQNTLLLDTLSKNAVITCTYYTTDLCYTNVPATESLTIDVNQIPIIDAGISLETGISEGVPLRPIINGGLAPYQYNWTPIENLSDPHAANPIASPKITTQYYVEIIDANGCSNNDSVLVTVFDFLNAFYIPNAFSPNGDQQNDVLYVRGKGIKEMQFVIYDRWEKEIFSTTSKDIGWDGTYKGTMLNPATFIYYLKIKTYDGKLIEKKGNVTLVK